MLFFLALVASATAQTSLSTGPNGDLRAARQETVGVFELQNELSSQAVTIEMLQAQVSTLMGTDSPIAAVVRAVASQMTADARELVATSTANNLRINQLEASMSAQTAATSGVVTQMTTLETEVQSELSTAQSQMDVTLEAAEATITTMGETLTASVTSSLNSANAALTANLNAMNASVNTRLGRVRSDLAHVWSGGCSQGRHGGWHDFCMDRVEVDTARPFFFRRTTVRLRSLVDGVFDIRFGRMMTFCHWEHTAININGSRRRHSHKWWHTSNWDDQHISIMYRIPANQDFWGEAYGGCGWTTWHTSTTYSRFDARWEGKRA